MALEKAPSGVEVLVVYDSDRPNYVRFVEHDGYVYMESHGRHNGTEVCTLVRIERARFVATVKGWFL